MSDVDKNESSELSLSEKIFDTGVTGFDRQFATLAKEGSPESLKEIFVLVEGSSLHVAAAISALDENGSDLANELIGKIAVDQPDKISMAFEHLARKSTQSAIDTVQYVLGNVDSNAVDMGAVSQAAENSIAVIEQNIDALQHAQNTEISDDFTIEDHAPETLEV